MRVLSRGGGGNLNDEEFIIFLEHLPLLNVTDTFFEINNYLAPITSILVTEQADSIENHTNRHLFKVQTGELLIPQNARDYHIVCGFSYKNIPVISKFIAGNRGFNWYERKGNLLERITVDGEDFYGNELVEDTVNFIKFLYSPDSSEFVKIVSKEEYENYYITNKQLVEKDNI